jgi:hypothetical protein
MLRNRVDIRGVLTLACFSRLVLDFIIPILLVAGTIVLFICSMIFERMILGNAPGVLPCVVRLCVRTFDCITRFDVGLFAFCIRGVSITL